MSKLSGAMWHHVPKPSMFPKWIPVDTHVSEGNLYIKSLCSLSTQSIWRNIKSDSYPNKRPFLTSKPNEKHSPYKTLKQIKEFLQRHPDLMLNFQNSRKFKKSSSHLTTEHKIGTCPVLPEICNTSQLLFPKLRFTYVGRKFKNASHAKFFRCYCSTATPTRELCLVCN